MLNMRRELLRSAGHGGAVHIDEPPAQSRLCVEIPPSTIGSTGV
jgi:hypothetical protein